MLPALIGAGASLLGGLLGRSSEKKAISAQNAYNDPAAVRARFEAAGFNPLLGIQPGVGMQATTGGTNFMGSAVADAGMLLADGFQKKRDDQVTSLNAQNSALQKRVNNLTLRPPEPGIYARRAVVGARDANNRNPVSVLRSNVLAGPSDRVLTDTDTGSGSDPRRRVDNLDIKSHPGYFVVDNPAVNGKLRVPTLDGDEALHWYDYPSLIVPMLNRMGEQRAADNAFRRMQPPAPYHKPRGYLSPSKTVRVIRRGSGEIVRREAGPGWTTNPSNGMMVLR